MMGREKIHTAVHHLHIDPQIVIEQGIFEKVKPDQ